MRVREPDENIIKPNSVPEWEEIAERGSNSHEITDRANKIYGKLLREGIKFEIRASGHLGAGGHFPDLGSCY